MPLTQDERIEVIEDFFSTNDYAVHTTYEHVLQDDRDDLPVIRSTMQLCKIGNAFNTKVVVQEDRNGEIAEMYIPLRRVDDPEAVLEALQEYGVWKNVITHTEKHPRQLVHEACEKLMEWDETPKEVVSLLQEALNV